MNTSNDHIVQAEYNEGVFLYLQSVAGRYQDWQVTCLHYAALHWVDAYLHQLNPPAGIRPRTHGERLRLVETHFGTSLMVDYRELQDRSQDARYEGHKFTDAQVSAWYTSQFARIRTHVRTALALPL